MHHTHDFDCPVCGTHPDSRDQLEQHRTNTHSGGQSASGSVSGADRSQGGASHGTSPGSGNGSQNT